MKLLRAIAVAAAIFVLAPPPPASAQISPNAVWSCEFTNSPTDCGLYLEAVASNRATIVSPGRDGPTAVQLTTQPGDINIAGSGSNDRADLVLARSSTYCNQGQDEWWAHSLMFPPGYVPPPVASVWNWGALFDFHNSSPGGGQPNFMVYATPTGLELHMAGGPNTVNLPSDPGYYSIVIGPITKNVWYDFVYHVKWSSGADGLFQAWLNGQQVMNYSGANLYVGQSCYLKIANYHTELGVPVSVVHSRVVMGHTQADVQIGSPPPPTVLVPNVVGQMQAAATSAIISAGLTLGTVTMQSSTTVAPGNVISQSPAAGTSVASGLAVNLVVSSGAPPPAPVPVPNVVGQTQAAATSAITGAGLTVGTVTMQSSTTVPSGNVIGQNPAAGAQSASGSAVDLVVSTGGGTSSGGGGGGASGGGGAFDSFTLAALLSSLIGGLWRARRIRDSVLRRETRGLRTSGNHQPAGGVGATSADVCLLRRVRVALCNRSSIGFSTSLYVTAANSSAKNVVAAANAIDSSPDDDATINLRHITRARCNEKTCVK
ncbi:MAG: PASTA domain-containing protein [Gammaproteobacteria bacterium]|nr:MAG: PASTA domain-containing protein [Gammaproteobacteria bacterium]